MSITSRYKPSDNHPWRKYRDRHPTGQLSETLHKSPPLKDFLKSLVDNWDTYTVPVEGEEYIKLKTLSDEKKALWISRFMKKVWTHEVTRGDAL